MKQRTKAFALRVIKVANSISKDFVGRRIADQLLRSGTSVAANYRSACRARSRLDFVNKPGIVEEEADESALWIELLEESGILSQRKLASLLDEANQITAIIVASRKSVNKSANQNQNSKIKNLINAIRKRAVKLLGAAGLCANGLGRVRRRHFLARRVPPCVRLFRAARIVRA